MRMIVLRRGMPLPRYILITSHNPPMAMTADNLGTFLALIKRERGTPYRYAGSRTYKEMTRDQLYRN